MTKKLHNTMLIFVPKMAEKIVIHWFRRDLRLYDNCALYHALKTGLKVLPIFIFDKKILEELKPEDKRVSLIYDTIQQLNNELYNKYHSGIGVFFDYPENVFLKLMKKYEIYAVFTNNDYEPYAIQRDEMIKQLLDKNKIHFIQYKDHVIFEKKEVVKDDGEPYLIYTHYSRAWNKKFQQIYSGRLPNFPSDKYLNNLITFENKAEIPPLQTIGFTKVPYVLKPLNIDENILIEYANSRDKIDIENGTSNASVYIRFGLVSIRDLVKKGLSTSPSFLNELIWREFFEMLIYHYPYTAQNNFRENIQIHWENNEKYFEAWRDGKTGFPIIDAAMRELNETGYMHNRCRMIVANFLTKILLIDWRWGERYFASQLMDYEMAANVGNWQWSAGTGVDAAPYFRIFNPYVQQQKFDPHFHYIKKWIPDFQPNKYIKPIVDYEERRKYALKAHSK